MLLPHGQFAHLAVEHASDVITVALDLRRIVIDLGLDVKPVFDLIRVID